MGILETVAWVSGITFSLAILFSVFSVISQNASSKKIEEAADNLEMKALRKFPDYQGRPAVRGAQLVLIMNTDKRKALVVSGQGFAKEIPFEKFTEAEIITDGHTIAETKRKGAVGRALVGGILTGGAGAVVGALTAKSISTSNRRITAIDVTLLSNDEQFPKLQWSVFSPGMVLQSLDQMEAEHYLSEAAAIYNSFSPIFSLHANEENGLVEI